jgi:hypothetical protein
MPQAIGQQVVFSFRRYRIGGRRVDPPEEKRGVRVDGKGRRARIWRELHLEWQKEHVELVLCSGRKYV